VPALQGKLDDCLGR